MKKFMAVVLVFGLAAVITGCAKKESVSNTVAQARQYLADGTAFLKQGDVPAAIKSFATAVKVAPENFEGYFMLGETLVRLKQYPQAISVMSAAIRKFPNNGLAYYLLALGHEGAQQPVAAIVAARRSVELFNASGDKEGAQRAMILLAGLVASAKEQAEKQMAENSAKDAASAVTEAVTAPATAGQ